MNKNVLELFSGNESFSKEARKRGFNTFTVDLEEDFEPDLCKDVLELTLDDIPFRPDIIWASPPCKTFSVASIHYHWKGGKCAYIPKTEKCKKGLDLVNKTLSFINKLNPKFWLIENPRGVLRKIGLMKNLPKNTVTYCQYGHNRMKPTDLWNNIERWKPRPMCNKGDPCHKSAPRGSLNGVQGQKRKNRSLVPPELCNEILDVIEGKDFKIKNLKDF